MESNHPRKPKILIVLGSGTWGGGEKHCLDIINGLNPEFSFTLIHSPGEKIEKKLSNEAFERYEFPLHLFPTFNRLKDFVELIEQINPDLIHSHLNRAQLYLSFAKSKIKRPWISTVHGFTSQIYNLRPDHLICVSKAIQNDLWTPLKRKSTLIYNGIIPFPSKSKTQSLSSRRTQQIPKAMVLATLHPNKGQLFLCEALSEHKLLVEIELIGTGKLEYIKKIKSAIKSNPNIRLINELSKTVSNLYRNIDFVIIPSYKEALSYVALESLTERVPVLASRTGGLCEIIEDEFNGLFFEAGNAKSLQQSLTKMIENWDTYKKNLNSEPFLIKNPQFRMDTMLKNLSLIYKKLMNK